MTSISGGGGVFAVPTMMAFGLPPLTTLALNRISDVGVLIGAIRNYMKIPEFNLKLVFVCVVPLLIGAFIGVNFSVNASPTVLKYFILGAVFIGIILLLWPIKPRLEDVKPNYWLGIPAILAIGFWDGAIAMAGATFAVIALVRLFNCNFLQARSVQIMAGVPETILSCSILLYHAEVDIALAIAMLLSSIVGAFVGSKLAIKKGSRFIRYSMVAISIIMVVKIIYDLTLGSS